MVQNAAEKSLKLLCSLKGTREIFEVVMQPKGLGINLKGCVAAKRTTDEFFEVVLRTRGSI